MSLRDYFAAKAMQAFIAQPTDESRLSDAREIARFAYDQADAMLAARKS